MKTKICLFALALTYVLLSRDGLVCVYNGVASAEPELVTEIRTAALPAEDAEALRRGISVADREELLRILEDLGS